MEFIVTGGILILGILLLIFLSGIRFIPNNRIGQDLEKKSCIETRKR